MIAVRGMIQPMALDSGPFALVYPTVLVATLFGHLAGGITAWLLSFLWAWYVILPVHMSFVLASPADGSRVALNALSALVVVVFAEGFRRAVRTANEQLAAAAERRLQLLTELEHRTKNNFALVASMLDIQRRRHEEPEVRIALEDASRRVMTFASAYSNLAQEQDEGAEVTMRPYLEQLVDRLSGASFPEGVVVSREIADIVLPREEGVAIGLFLNEALANTAKYGFSDGREGKVSVVLSGQPQSWTMTVKDDGCGDSAPDLIHSGGVGGQLMTAFARQARAVHRSTIGPGGCEVVLQRER